MNFKERVKQNEDMLNETDESIVSYIQSIMHDISVISIHNIAKQLYVSPNAIMRTAKKLGYSGFAELKFSLQQEMSKKVEKSAANLLLDKIPQNIIKSLDVLEDDKVDQLVCAIHKSHKILVAGIGDSVYFCEMMARYLRCFEVSVEYFQQPHDIEYALGFYGEKDLVIMISGSGENERMLRFAKIAKSKRSKIFCITNYGNNRLSQISDTQICFYGEERKVNGYNVRDRSGLMMLLRIICDEFGKKQCE